MSTDTEEDIDERSKWSLWAIGAAVLLALLFGMIAVGGIRGCAFLDSQEAAKRDREKKKLELKKKRTKDEYEVSVPIVEPAESQRSSTAVKPGHWATANQKMRANYSNFVGELNATLVDRQRESYPVDRTPFVLRANRPVLLTKGRPKFTESTSFVPQTNTSLTLSTQLVERGLGLTIPSRASLSRMPSYQYHFVVLAKESSRYSYIKTIDSVKVPFGGEDEFDSIENTTHYRVGLLDTSQSIPLSANPLTWTSIAYILWDEIDPALFTPEQERTLVDWIHWGGQLIVSGPDSLDLLRGSFLDEYLPAANGGPRTIAADDPAIAELNRGWMISSPITRGEPLRPSAPWSAIKLDIDPQARALPNTGQLFAERQIGRGRIVVSAMQLAERDLVNWKSGFESLFNACLLRRPPREYHKGSFGGATLLWADESLRDRRLDARLTTNLRYFARDLGVETAYRRQEVSDDANQMAINQFGQPVTVREYVPPKNSGGIGAWNDFGATANAAREALREAAGVEVPGAGFVVMCLAAYLVALVPLNWLIFHALGRIEWAWLAAPIIAVTGTVVVVHQAQLDIGFVRAQTEIGLLEQQPDYPRAHLSRYTALYTSLSTTYDLEFGNLTTLAAPFPTGADYAMLRGQGLQEIDFERYENVRLADMPVSSNSTGMVHSEQMISNDGAIRLGQSTARGRNQIENRTKLELHSVCVVRRPLPEERPSPGVRLEGMWIGDMLAGQSMPASLRPFRFTQGQAPFQAERAAEERLQRGERLNLERMFRLALDPEHMEPGEMRLVARVDNILPGENITPAASQVRGATLVVAHLQYAPPPPPRSDRNTRADVKADTENETLDVFE